MSLTGSEVCDVHVCEDGVGQLVVSQWDTSVCCLLKSGTQQGGTAVTLKTNNYELVFGY